MKYISFIINIYCRNIFVYFIYIYIYVYAYGSNSVQVTGRVFFAWGWVGVGWDHHVTALAFSCTSTHKSCYGAVFSHALPHISYATLLCFLIHFHILPHLCHAILILLCVLLFLHSASLCYASTFATSSGTQHVTWLLLR